MTWPAPARLQKLNNGAMREKEHTEEPRVNLPLVTDEVGDGAIVGSPDSDGVMKTLISQQMPAEWASPRRYGVLCAFAFNAGANAFLFMDFATSETLSKHVRRLFKAARMHLSFA
eukprot:6190663-Pleurochrysis_carterae.AAC.5